MTKFYKGIVVDVNKLSTINYHLDIVKENANDSIKKLSYYIDELSCEEVGEDKKREIDKIMIDMFKPNSTSFKGKEIIYRKFIDENGNMYGKELISNTIFPINNGFSNYNINYSRNGKSEIFYDALKDEVFAIFDPDAVAVCLLENDYKPETFLTLTLADKIMRMELNSRREVVIDKRVYDIMSLQAFAYKIEIEPEMSFPDNQIINYAITNESRANSLEVRNYCEVYEKGFGKWQRERELCGIMRSMSIRNNLGNYYLKPEEPETENKRFIKKI